MLLVELPKQLIDKLRSNIYLELFDGNDKCSNRIFYFQIDALCSNYLQKTFERGTGHVTRALLGSISSALKLESRLRRNGFRS